MIHNLKIWPQYFEAVQRGDKTLELRKNDRNYQVGDTLHLHEWDPATETYTGRECSRLVTDVVFEGEWFAPGYCAMSIVDDDRTKLVNLLIRTAKWYIEEGLIPTKDGPLAPILEALDELNK